MEDKKTYLITADTPFEATYPFSLCDAQIPPRYIRKVFIYSLDGDEPGVAPSGVMDDLVSCLRDTLKTFLRPLDEGGFAFPQLLGQVVNQADGLPCIVVRKSSAIRFIVSSRPDLDFESLHPERRFPDEALRMEDFATGLNLPDMMKAPNGPENFVVQLTSIRGGFVLNLQVSHRITDGYGFAGFIRRWFAKARSFPMNGSLENPEQQQTDLPLAVAIHDKESLAEDMHVPRVKGTMSSVKKWEALSANAPTTMIRNVFHGDSTIESRLFSIPNDRLEELRDVMTTHTPVRPTAFEAMVTLAWQCLARARLEPEDRDDDAKISNKMSTAALAVDIRKRLDPPLPIDYFGNAITPFILRLPVSLLASPAPGANSVIIQAVQTTIREEGTEANIRGTIRYLTDGLKSGKTFPIDLMGNDVMFNTWEHLFSSTEDLDLGTGQFCAVRYMMDTPLAPSYALIQPSFGQRGRTASAQGSPHEYPGGIELRFNLPKRQLDRLEQDAEWSHYARAI